MARFFIRSDLQQAAVSMAKKSSKGEDAFAEAQRRIAKCLTQRKRELDLSGLGLTVLPAEIGQLTDLTELNLSGNQLRALPAEIGQLKALTALNLSDNQLRALPAEIGQLKAMTWLNLDRNHLRALPAEIGQLKAMTELYLSGNQLSALPAEIGQLKALTKLDLYGNQLSALPAEIGQLKALTGLDLSSNQLSALPAEIGQLKDLMGLYLMNNQLSALPAEIGQLKALMSLGLSSNQLSALPAEIGQLKALAELNLTSNQLRALPAEIGQLKALTTLDLSGNQLSALPAEIGQLTDLTALYLHDNPGLGLPTEILGPTLQEVYGERKQPKPPAEILAAYFRIAGDQGETLNECKLIVVGRGGAGKTSLIKRLNGQPFDRNESETHGITIQDLPFQCEQGTVTAHAWDFGGQVVLHSMHEFFLTARSLYLLVLGERDDMLERDAAYWLQLIRSYAGDAPVVVALNKSGGRQRSFDQQTLEKQFGPILGFVPTECSEEDLERGGIEKLRTVLTAALDSQHMDSVRRKFPRKWHAIKKDLEAMQDSYLDYPEYIRRCEKHQETEAKEQQALAGDLHDLGIALNYARDPRLRDTTVLRPNWLANGIYAVLRANDRDERIAKEFSDDLAPGGVVTVDSLAQIHRKAEAWGMLQAADYPLKKREFLLRLMDLFHLSYPLDDEGKQQLVPTLLPLTPPSGTDEPLGPGAIRLRYEFQVVPAPLIPSFIARTFSLIPGKLHWRRGAMLKFGDALARVWMTQDERFVFVTVVGPEHDQRRLLAMIRGTLARIFGEYKAVTPEEQVEHRGRWVPRGTLEEFGVLPVQPQHDPRNVDRDGEEREVRQ